MTIPSTLAALVPWVISHGYIIIFLVSLVEGSLITAAAGVAAGLGYFNIFLVILISNSADLIGDVFYYHIGKYSSGVLDSKFFKFLGFHEERVLKIKNLLHNNIYKALLVIKLSPLIGPTGLITVGAVRVPFPRFFRSTVVISTVKASFFGFLGFLLSKTYLHSGKLLNHVEYIAFGLVLIFIFIQIAYTKITRRLAEKLEK
jgi:membrane protein DedA with SNARE-associated domain